MHYKNSKEKDCGKGSAYDDSTNSSQSPSPCEKEKNDNKKEELKKMKESINNARYKMYKTAGFKKSQDTLIADETVKVSKELDVLIVEYYKKNNIC
ncbi:aspartyl-phosphate phosphatase Spo0E family protein [Maledivibacter halophilus]|uniref:Spo0E like sporulation regulatory protein n=1 Tax=Maledivibacter halophilus TaxID=36842 RepID=A0A1T5ILL8_9FIRM|nr:aspartyl-phosphate phosphatase Spo0E family protein [Maledivibacter halophilus]SKC40019.1 Spo0E like sporulation regulatory protein [Maledivibacter halophilus]